MESLSYIETTLRNFFGVEGLKIEAEQVGGGDTHRSFVIRLNKFSDEKGVVPKQLFVKLNSKLGVDILKTEFESLQIINALTSDLYPKAVLFETYRDQAVLFMAFHQIEPLGSANAALAGQALAQQHRIIGDTFGWSSENYIGATKQRNQRTNNWSVFFKDQRLTPMLQLARRNGLSAQSVDRVHDLISNLDLIFTHRVVPSLVHGDLWSGNVGFDGQRLGPLLYDPAPYYGDREVDIAMTELFGRQPESFYQAYQAAWPLEEGYELRRPVYNLYHALNHVVLFGCSYNSLVDSCFEQIKC